MDIVHSPFFALALCWPIATTAASQSMPIQPDVILRDDYTKGLGRKACVGLSELTYSPQHGPNEKTVSTLGRITATPNGADNGETPVVLVVVPRAHAQLDPAHSQGQDVNAGIGPEIEGGDFVRRDSGQVVLNPVGLQEERSLAVGRSPPRRFLGSSKTIGSSAVRHNP